MYPEELPLLWLLVPVLHDQLEEVLLLLWLVLLQELVVHHLLLEASQALQVLAEEVPLQDFHLSLDSNSLPDPHHLDLLRQEDRLAGDQ